MNKIPIEDIFAPIVVPDNSFSLLILCMSLFVALLFVLYFFYRKRVKKTKKDEAYYLNILLHCNFYNVKQSAYLFTYYGRKLAKTKAQKKSVEEIISQLFIQKYQQKSLNISKSLQKEIERFLEQLREYYA